MAAPADSTITPDELATASTPSAWRLTRWSTPPTWRASTPTPPSYRPARASTRLRQFQRDLGKRGHPGLQVPSSRPRKHRSEGIGDLRHRAAAAANEIAQLRGDAYLAGDNELAAELKQLDKLLGGRRGAVTLSAYESLRAAA